MKVLSLAVLAIAAPAVAQAPAAQRPQLVSITMTEDGFAPRRIVLASGAPVVLRITNVTGTGHNLNQDAFFADARVAPDSRRLLNGGTVSVGAHERVTLRLRAPVNRPGATYRFSSTVLGDAGDNYKGWFVIR